MITHTHTHTHTHRFWHILRLFLSKAHSSVERAALIGGVMMRKVPTDNSYAVGGDMLRKMVEEDKAAGLIPFYVRQDRKHLAIKQLQG